MEIQENKTELLYGNFLIFFDEGGNEHIVGIHVIWKNMTHEGICAKKWPGSASCTFGHKVEVKRLH